MNKKHKAQNEPRSAPIYIRPVLMDYSDVKLFVAKKLVNGKKVPYTGSGYRWYVYFYYRSPSTGRMDHKCMYYDGINKYKTVKERKAYGKNLVRAYTKLLQEGFNPLENTIKTDPENLAHISLLDAFKNTVAIKNKEIALETQKDWKYKALQFENYLIKRNLDTINVRDLKTSHIIQYLNFVSNRGVSNKTVNNHRSFLSPIFSKMLNNQIIEHNPVSGIEIRKTTPEKNKPFTAEEIEKIKKYIEKNNYLLLVFIRFVSYGFLRPIEVVRIKIKDIDLTNNQLFVQSKTEKRATIRIVPQLHKEILKMNVAKRNKEDYLFTIHDDFTNWDSDIANKRGYFSKQFLKVKKNLDYGREYGIYSFRHSFAVNLYQSFIKEGLNDTEAQLKMLPITRHKSLSGLRNYLRDIGAFLPEDYSDKFSIDL